MEAHLSPLWEITWCDGTRLRQTWMGTSRAFRKFVISSGRLFEHEILGYREQSRDDFSRPFGKETRHANAHCSPHHFTAKRPDGSANVRPSPFHAAITGLTGPHDLAGCRVGPTDQPANRPRVGLFQPHGGQMATALPGPGLVGSARCPSLRASANDCRSYSCAGHLRGQHFTTRPGAPRHPLDLG